MLRVGECVEVSRGLPALALNADTAVLTAWSNDMGYENVFAARQVEAFGRAGDVCSDAQDVFNRVPIMCCHAFFLIGASWPRFLTELYKSAQLC